MKKIVIAVLLQMVFATVWGQTLSLKYFGERFQRTNLIVRWDISTNTWPSQMWVYRVLSNEFSPQIISNVMSMCSFTEKDRTKEDANEIIFRTSDAARILSIYFSSGGINYEAVEPHYGATNLAVGVPKMDELPDLTKDFLQKIGVNISDIEKKTNGSPDLRFWEPYTWYFTKDGIITNIAFRAAVFSRAVDGATVIGNRGQSEIHFGEHGKICKIDFSWPKIKRYKSYPTASPEMIVQWMREGKAVQGLIPMNANPIDWASVKSVTVKKIWPSYYAGERTSPSEWLMPYLALWTTVDTGNGNVDVEIDCPIIDDIDESQK